MTTKEKFEQLKELELKAKTKKELDSIQLEFDQLATVDPDGFEDAKSRKTAKGKRADKRNAGNYINVVYCKNLLQQNKKLDESAYKRIECKRKARSVYP